jgi:hypothetical protein
MRTADCCASSDDARLGRCPGPDLPSRLSLAGAPPPTTTTIFNTNTMPSTNTAQQPSSAPPPYFSGSDTEEGSSADEEYRQSLRAPGVDLTRVRVRRPFPFLLLRLPVDWPFRLTLLAYLLAPQSAQDEELPLPDGWIRQYDPKCAPRPSEPVARPRADGLKPAARVSSQF